MFKRHFIPILLTLLAHLLLLRWAVGPHTALIEPPEVFVPVTLTQIPVLTKTKAVHPKKAVAPVSKPPTPPVATNTPSMSPLPQSASSEVAAVVAPPATAVVPPAEPAPIAEPAAVAATVLTTLPPPSASYQLDVVRTEVNVANPYYGAGEIRWQQDGANYKMHIEVGVDLLFTTIRLYSMDSSGSLSDNGIEPHTVVETRRTRSTTTTQFNYDTHSFSFSASPITLPMAAGAQDKATVLMQLASIANADPTQFFQGREITIQVAEEKEASPYQFIVLDQETIDTRLGHLSTWHVVRPPRPGVYSSRLDIWFAPQYNWLPVQIRNTETNGAITTQTIRKITAGIKP